MRTCDSVGRYVGSGTDAKELEKNRKYEPIHARLLLLLAIWALKQ